MNKMRAFSFILIALALGFLGGAFSIQSISKRTERILEMERQEDRADIALRALRHFREDSTNTVPFLEVQLDDATVCLGHLVADVPASQRDRTALLMLAKVRDYRATHPHKSQQRGLDEEIRHAFTLPDEKQ